MTSTIKILADICSRLYFVGKTAIVTGGSQGIGLATSLLLASRGCRVIIANRSDATEARKHIIEKTANSNIITRKLDLTSFESIRTFVKIINETEEKIDILINNAGIGLTKTLTTEDGLDAVIQTNVYGPFLLTHLLMGKLRSTNNARIIFVTSGLALFHSLNVNWLDRAYKDNIVDHILTYANSKATNILLAQEFANKLTNIYVSAADPGVAGTNIFLPLHEGTWITRLLNQMLKPLYSDVLQAAQTIFHLAASNDLSGNGKLYFRCAVYPKMSVYSDEEICRQIWRKCEVKTNLKTEEKLKIE